MDTDLATPPLLDALRPATLVPEAGWRQAAGGHWMAARCEEALRLYDSGEAEAIPVARFAALLTLTGAFEEPGASRPSPSNASPPSPITVGEPADHNALGHLVLLKAVSWRRCPKGWASGRLSVRGTRDRDAPGTP